MAVIEKKVEVKVSAAKKRESSTKRACTFGRGSEAMTSKAAGRDVGA